jgi:hypothetical protein
MKAWQLVLLLGVAALAVGAVVTYTRKAQAAATGVGVTGYLTSIGVGPGATPQDVLSQILTSSMDVIAGPETGVVTNTQGLLPQ